MAAITASTLQCESSAGFASDDRQLKPLIRRHRHQQSMHVVDRRDEPIGQRDNDVARLDAGLRSQAARHHLLHLDGLFGQQVELAPHDARGKCTTDAPMPSCRRRTLPCVRISVDHPLGRVRRNRKADPLRHRDDRRVDAHDQPARVDERPARIARIDRRRVLHDVLDQPSIAARMLRPSALTTPVDTVDCNPSGLPIAITS